VALEFVDDAGRLGDPSDPVGKPFFGALFDPGPLRTHLPAMNPYLRVACRLCNHPETTPSPAVAFGPTVEQTPLVDGDAGAVSG